MRKLKFPQIYRVSLWSPDKLRIQKRYFLKNEIYFGDDSKAEIRFGNKGFRARLNFQAQEFEDFHLNEIISLAPERLHSMDEIVFNWSILRVSKKILAFMACLGAFFLVSIFRPTFQKCQNPADISKIQLNLESLLEEKDFLKARSQLLVWRKKMEEENSCYADQYAFLEGQLTEALVLFNLERGRFLEASEIYKRYSTMFGTRDFQILESKILSGAKQIYWKSWRLERQEPGASYELAKTAQQICQNLGRIEACFDEGSSK